MDAVDGPEDVFGDADEGNLDEDACDGGVPGSVWVGVGWERDDGGCSADIAGFGAM